MEKNEANKQPNIRLKKMLVVLGFLIFLIFSVNSCEKAKNPKLKSSPQTQVEKKDEEGTTAKICAKNEVKKSLKSPSSADFPWNLGSVLSVNQESSYLVKGYVDAENSFGAEIRNSYVCIVDIVDSEKFICNSECTIE